jgi:ribosome biogenesis GTPase
MPRAPTLGGLLIDYAWTDRVAERFAAFADADLVPGRIVRADKGGYLAVTGRDLEFCSRAPFRASAPEGLRAATGDWAAMRRLSDSGLRLEAIVPRSTVVRRTGASDTGNQVLAANADTVFLLFGMDRPLKPGRVERLLTLVWNGGARPVVLATKSDVGGDAADRERFVSAAETSAPGVEVAAVSAVTGQGVGALAPFLDSGRTIVLLGESGTGKSTLANHLAGGAHLATGPTRRSDAKGRHTTTAREMLPIPGGAVLIDTPGLRAVALADSAGGFAASFPEIEELGAGCRFRDCGHDHEPGCAVIAAVESGDLPPRRLASFRKLRSEVAHQARRAAYRARVVESRQGRKRYRRERVIRREE